MTDGTSITRECLSAPGGPDQPFEDRVILDKIRHITELSCPRFGPAFEDLLDLDAAKLARPWRSLIEGALAGAA